jgi:hypothetical protein
MNPIINLINRVFDVYPLNGQFIFPVTDEAVASKKLKEITLTSGVPSFPGNYFIYAPYNRNLLNADNLSQQINGRVYVLVNVAKAGMKKSGYLNLRQFIIERINNVGEKDIPRSILWSQFMRREEFHFNHLLFRWVVTMKKNETSFDNCYLLEQEFYKIWKESPGFRPELNK